MKYIWKKPILSGVGIDEGTCIIFTEKNKHNEYCGYLYKNDYKGNIKNTHIDNNIKYYCKVNKDLILCDTEAGYFFYSINESKKIEYPEWLYGIKTINPILVKDKDNNEKVLLDVIKRSTSSFDSPYCLKDNYVEVLVDPDTFRPVSNAYSSLRDQNIRVRKGLDIDSIIKEDYCYEIIIDEYLKDNNISCSNASIQKILNPKKFK